MSVNGEQDNRGGTVGLRRLLSGIGATFALGLALTASSASAKTVYDYVYSGTYIDGSSVSKPFTSGLADLGYDSHSHKLTVLNGGTPGTVSRWTLGGAAAPFASLGTNWFTVEPNMSSNANITIDQSGGASDGNFYIRGAEFGQSTITGYKPDGSHVAFEPEELTGEGACGLALTPDGTELAYAARGGIFHMSPAGKRLGQDFVGPAGIQPGVKIRGGETLRPCDLEYDNNGDIYGTGVQFGFNQTGPAIKLSPTGLQYYLLNHSENTRGVAVDHSNNDVFVLDSPQYGSNNTTFELFDEAGRLLGGGWGKEDAAHSFEGLRPGSFGITVDPSTHDVWVADHREYGGVAHVEKFEPTNPHVIPDTTAEPAGYPDPAGEHMLLKGVINADGVETTECFFAYGSEQTGVEEGVVTAANYEQLTETVPCQQGNHFSGNEDHTVTAEIPTAKGELYFYKLVAKNADEQLAPSNVRRFVPQGKPILPGFLAVDRVNTDGVRFSTEFDPNGGNASVHFEYGEAGKGFEASTQESPTFGFVSGPGLFNGENTYLPGIQQVSVETKGLKPGVTYEYRAVVTNEAGSVASPTQEFTTYVPDSGVDPCENAEVRRQTEASLLPDCRAYELASAANQGGYDVESDLAPGQTPLDAYPDAQGRLLYSMHFGVIPGIAGSPTNDGLDPYIAVRGKEGWTTKYVGLPADGMPDHGAFGSPLLGADSALETFAFGGPNICNPCFSEGGDETTNIPLRRANGTLEKGMAGSLNPIGADPVGEVRRALSADGSHLIFGSDKKFEADASSGTMWIYSRNLSAKTTELVSTSPAGTPLTGEVAELDVSSNGSRVLIGKKVGEDGAGNNLYDLYMHIAGQAASVQVADTASGAIYNGMTGDGGKVFFTTTDALSGDTDTSADLYRADVGTTSPAPVSRVSTGSGGTGNTDSCEPVVNWNVPAGGGNDCSVVVPAGGAGVARNDGTVYFISPEKLDGPGNGTQDQPNLYVESPGGTPRYVGEIDSSIGKPPPQPPAHPVISTNFVTGLNQPEGLAVDQETGAIYVAETGGGGRIARFDSSGSPLKFISGPGAGTNRIPNEGMYGTESEIAVDSSGGILDGAIYVMHGYGAVAVYGRDGSKLGELTGFGEACGVAVNQTTGELFVGDWSYGGMYRFVPTSATTPLSKANYTETSIHTQGQNPCHVGADSAGHAFAVSWSQGPIKRYNVSDFAASPPTIAGTEVAGTSKAVSSDPLTGDLYNDEGNRIVVYDSAGNEVAAFGSSASLGASSNGIAVNGETKETYALNGPNIVRFGYEQVPYEPIDNPAVIHGVNQAAVHDYEDFQVTPDGHYAVFGSPAPLTGYQNLGHYELYRYDAEEEELACVSCAPTNAVGKSDVKLSPHGLNLTDDGRVFFTTLESLTLRDTNEKKDAYEWCLAPNAACPSATRPRVGLISGGIGQDNSALVTVSSDGKDAFFYTRDVLVPTDKNGTVVKIYDAREGGGFLYDAPRGLCKASDECHGAGTETPPPPNINTTTGPEHARQPVRTSGKCPKGKVKRQGRCVKKPRHRHRKKHKRHSTRRHG